MKKIAEDIKLHSIVPEQYTAATVYWNGAAVTTRPGVGWDTRDYNSADIVVQIGTILGEAVTLSNALWESDQDNPTLAIAITGGSFTDRNSGNDETSEEGSLDLRERRRYLFLRTEVAGSVPTIHFSGGAVFGGPDSAPVSKTLVFDLQN